MATQDSEIIYLQWVPPKALSEIRVINKTCLEKEGWLNQPYFEGVREFLAFERYTRLKNSEPLTYINHFETNEVNSQNYNYQIVITVGATEVTMLRINLGKENSGFFDDVLPYRVVVEYQNFPNFMETYNYLFTYMENIWHYSIKSRISPRETSIVWRYPNCFIMKGKEIPAGASIKLLPIGNLSSGKITQIQISPYISDPKRFKCSSLKNPDYASPRRQLYTDFTRVYMREKGDMIMIAHHHPNEWYLPPTQEDREYALKKNIKVQDLTEKEIRGYYGCY